MDKLKELEVFARRILNENDRSDWTFQFDKAVKRYGYCNHTKCIISISKVLAELNTVSRTSRTILHEIGHAIAGRGHGHDKYWKECCRKIGLENPQRCYSGIDTVIFKDKYEYQCPHCKISVYYARKKKRKDFSCGICDTKYNPKYKLILINN